MLKDNVFDPACQSRIFTLLEKLFHFNSFKLELCHSTEASAQSQELATWNIADELFWVITLRL